MTREEESSEVQEVEEVEEVERDATPGIDEVLEGMGQDTTPSIGTTARPLVGEVVEARPTGRALVCWDDRQGNRTERELSVVRGLDLKEGDRVLLDKPHNWPEYLVTNAIERTAEPVDEIEGKMEELDVKVDGKRVEIEAADEIVLKCGEASITLRRNGRLVIRGTYVETRSKGTNRIKGGSVQIN